ncbi:MAG: hypothetical protein IPJ88_08905 [Myxococcales bacterium]|nr:MAG: hypothetical protein IPJ88_08905 [Myxococcales bacterium]
MRWVLLWDKAVVFCLFLSICFFAAGADAQQNKKSGGTAVLDQIPRLGGELHLSSVFPFLNGDFCPAGAGCVLDQGLGIGVSVERRWLSGLSFALGYDLWLLDTDSVYEQGVMQFFYGAARFYFLPTHELHPYLSAGFGAQMFGDTFKVATVGPAAQILLGSEWEMNSSLGFTAALGARLFRLASFTTASDGVEREPGGSISAMLTLQIGLSVLVL